MKIKKNPNENLNNYNQNISDLNNNAKENFSEELNNFTNPPMPNKFNTQNNPRNNYSNSNFPQKNSNNNFNNNNPNNLNNTNLINNNPQQFNKFNNKNFQEKQQFIDYKTLQQPQFQGMNQQINPKNPTFINNYNTNYNIQYPNSNNFKTPVNPQNNYPGLVQQNESYQNLLSQQQYYGQFQQGYGYGNAGMPQQMLNLNNPIQMVMGGYNMGNTNGMYPNMNMAGNSAVNMMGMQNPMVSNRQVQGMNVNNENNGSKKNL